MYEADLPLRLGIGSAESIEYVAFVLLVGEEE